MFLAFKTSLHDSTDDVPSSLVHQDVYSKPACASKSTRNQKYKLVGATVSKPDPAFCRESICLFTPLSELWTPDDKDQKVTMRGNNRDVILPASPCRLRERSLCFYRHAFYHVQFHEKE